MHPRLHVNLLAHALQLQRLETAEARGDIAEKLPESQSRVEGAGLPRINPTLDDKAYLVLVYGGVSSGLEAA